MITPNEKQMIAYHEAGHALVSELLPSVPKVHKISIVPRGQALGYTLNLPEEDRYLMSKEEASGARGDLLTTFFHLLVRVVLSRSVQAHPAEQRFAQILNRLPIS